MLYIKHSLLSSELCFCIYKTKITSNSEFISTYLITKKSDEENITLWLSIDCAVLCDLYAARVDRMTNLLYLNEKSRRTNNFDVVSVVPATKYKVYSQKDSRFKPLLLSLQEMILSYHEDIFVKCITDILLM